MGPPQPWERSLSTEMVACVSGKGQRRLWKCLRIVPVVLISSDLEIRPLVENDSE